MEPDLLEVKNLTTEFVSRRGRLVAVDNVSFTVGEGETVAVVGESGSGKSVMARSILRLIPEPPGRIAGGEVLLSGRDVMKMSDRQLRDVRGREIGMIFQDPMSSLDPVFTIGSQVAEALPSHSRRSRADRDGHVADLLSRVRIPNPRDRIGQYPHQFSGGMRQRVVAAIALAGGCNVLIADEPTTALDVTVQAQFIQLLKDLQRERRIGIIFITHDLGVVARIAHRILVMYAGRVVESGDVHDIFASPQHPYTRALLDSIPRMGEVLESLRGIPGQPPDPYQRPPGCPFAPRCSEKLDRCETEPPPTVRSADGKRSAECWLVEAL